MKRYLNYLILIISICYFVFIFAKKIIIPYPVGDESVFQRDLLLANSNSYSISISHNISIPYTYLTLMIFKLIGNSIIALKLVNFILTTLVISFLINSFKKIHSGEKLTYFITYLFFFIGTVGYFFIGTNDTLFYLGLIVLTTEVYLYLLGKGFNFGLVLATLAITSATRDMIIIFIPLIFLSFFFLMKNNFNRSTIIYFLIVPVIFVLILNISNIFNGLKLSYDSKHPPENYSNLNWTQRQYLSQLQVNSGKIPNKSHVSWNYLNEYLKVHGQHSLPGSLLESLFFDIKLTFKEFAKDFFDVLFYSTRQVGFSIFFIFYQLYFLLRNKINVTFNKDFYVFLVVILYILLFSFIIISFVELRWLCVPFVLSIFYFVDKCKTSYLFYNNIFLFLLMIYSIVKNNL